MFYGVTQGSVHEVQVAKPSKGEDWQIQPQEYNKGRLKGVPNNFTQPVKSSIRKKVLTDRPYNPSPGMMASDTPGKDWKRSPAEYETYRLTGKTNDPRFKLDPFKAPTVMNQVSNFRDHFALQDRLHPFQTTIGSLPEVFAKAQAKKDAAALLEAEFERRRVQVLQGQPIGGPAPVVAPAGRPDRRVDIAPVARPVARPVDLAPASRPPVTTHTHLPQSPTTTTTTATDTQKPNTHVGHEVKFDSGAGGAYVPYDDGEDVDGEDDIALTEIASTVAFDREVDDDGSSTVVLSLQSELDNLPKKLSEKATKKVSKDDYAKYYDNAIEALKARGVKIPGLKKGKTKEDYISGLKTIKKWYNQKIKDAIATHSNTYSKRATSSRRATSSSSYSQIVQRIV
jgi:hypothetical protein